MQEFQARGVVHFHAICEGVVSQERATLVWCRAADQSLDSAALRHSVKAEEIRSERGARSYLGQYMGKERQKLLPPGVEAGGRWWGRSRSLELVTSEEVVSCDRESGYTSPEGMRIVRCVRKYVSKVFRGKYRGGAFVDWGGALSARLVEIVRRLKRHYGEPGPLDSVLAAHGWVEVEEEGVRHGIR